MVQIAKCICSNWKMYFTALKGPPGHQRRTLLDACYIYCQQPQHTWIHDIEGLRENGGQSICQRGICSEHWTMMIENNDWEKWIGERGQEVNQTTTSLSMEIWSTNMATEDLIRRQGKSAGWQKSASGLIPPLHHSAGQRDPEWQHGWSRGYFVSPNPPSLFTLYWSLRSYLSSANHVQIKYILTRTKTVSTAGLRPTTSLSSLPIELY